MSTFDDPSYAPTTDGHVAALPQARIDERYEATNGGEARFRPDADARSRWVTENLAALQSSNGFVEQHGVPLAKYRRF
jgi:Post-segregation antitoxin CcdA